MHTEQALISPVLAEPSPETPWNVLCLDCGHELRSYEYLRNRGFEPYLPTYREPLRGHRQPDFAIRPLFPGYAFIRYEPLDKLHMLQTPGVRGLLTVAGAVAVVRQSEMDVVRQLEAMPDPRPWVLPPVGTQVVIKSGPLAGVCGVMFEHRGQCRVIVRVPMLGRMVAVQLEAGNVEVAA